MEVNSQIAHPELDRLLAYTRGELNETNERQIESHLDECEPCCRKLDGMSDDTIVHLLRDTAASDTGPTGSSTLSVGATPTGDPIRSEAIPTELRDHPKYDVLGSLGHGGMGQVYKAVHRVMHRMVAIKVIKQSLTASSEMVDRFQREVEAAAQLSHPNIVTAYDAEQAGDLHFLAMEYVDGVNLHQVLTDRGPLPVEEACDCIRQAALGLQHAFERGMVHRDIKPHNLMLNRDGQVKILDFGLANFVKRLATEEIRQPTSEHASSFDNSVTAPGTVMGTPDFIAPEQVEDAHSADIRADIYSLGCTFYALLTGQSPFHDCSVRQKVRAHSTRDATPVRQLRDSVPMEIERIVQRMMAKDPASRFQTPAEVAAELLPFARSEEKRVTAASTAAKKNRKRGLFAVVGAMFACLAVLSVVMYVRTSKGTIRVEINDPQISAEIAGQTITIKNSGEPIKIAPGAQKFTVHRGDLQFETDAFVLQRGKDVTLRVALIDGNVKAMLGNQVIGERGVRPESERTQVDMPPWNSLPPGSPPPAIAPFDAAKAKEYQAAWAKYLGLPVETENSLGMKFVLIPPGEFGMGATEREVARFLQLAKAWNLPGWFIEKLRAAAPQHHVRITKPFWLSSHEVTRGQFRRFVADQGYQTNAEKDGEGGYGRVNGQQSRDPRFVWNSDLGFDQTDDHPVVNVSWNDVTAFCAWLSDTEGEKSQLPTEAQWEYACRAGSMTMWYPSDDEDALKEYGWFGTNSSGGTHPVGHKSPNAWGLYDMHGNAWEWCQDYFGHRYYATSPTDDPIGASGGWERIRRGGGWKDGAPYCRSSNRYWSDPTDRNESLGFRVARIVSFPVGGRTSPQKVAASPQSQAPPTPKPSAPATPPSAASPGPSWVLPAGSPPPAVAPFDAKTAKEHQAAWAKYLGVEVEKTNSIGMRLVLIPPGEFDMGSTEAEVAKLLVQAKASTQSDWYIDKLLAEAPKHRVRITKPFWLGRHEVTRGQFRRFVTERGYRTEAECDGKGGGGLINGQWKEDPLFVWNADSGLDQTDDHPVVNVTWNDVTAFCTWLSEKEGETLQLPTEAQWEYACRAGTTTMWYLGDDETALKEAAWLGANTGMKTHPVGCKVANAWGLYDMHGNVWERCQDWWSAGYYSTSPMDDPTGVNGGERRVDRGGAYWCDTLRCRASYRYANVPGHRNCDLGFRVAGIVSSSPERLKNAQ